MRIMPELFIKDDQGDHSTDCELFTLILVHYVTSTLSLTVSNLRAQM